MRHEVPADFGRPSHWDLLLERDANCWTWAVEHLPGPFGGSRDGLSVEALRLPAHRKFYLDHEGPVSGDRGTVRRELAGECRWISVNDNRVRVQLEFDGTTVDVVIEQVRDDRWKLSVQ